MPIFESTRTGFRRLIFALAYVLCIVLLFESASWATLRFLRGSWMGPSSIREEAVKVVSAEVDVQDIAKPDQPPLWEEIFHPYIGISYPVRDRQNVRGTAQENLADYGFHKDAGLLYTERTENRVIINIVGGSVARAFLDNGGAEVLKAELQKDARYKGKDIVFSSLAFYGYKEPQQLLAVNYLLTLGAQFDIIIALDGFNEIAMGKIYNADTGASPFYPWGWHWRLWKVVPDPDQALSRGEIAYLRQKRADSAASFATSWRRFSGLASLLWSVWDQNRASEIGGKMSMLMGGEGVAKNADVIDPGPFPHYETDDAYINDQVSVWENGTRQLAKLSEANDIEFHSVLQPNQYAGKHVMTAAERKISWSEGPEKPLVEAGYPKLRDAGKRLAQEGISFTDATDLYDSVRESVYTDACCHLSTPFSNAILARRLARIILAKPPQAP